MNLATPLGPLASDFERTSFNWWDVLQVAVYVVAGILLFMAVVKMAVAADQKEGKKEAAASAAGLVVVSLLLSGLTHFVVGDWAQNRSDASAAHNLELLKDAYPSFTFSAAAAECVEEVAGSDSYFFGSSNPCDGIDKVVGDQLVRVKFVQADGRITILAPKSKHRKGRVIAADADLLEDPGAEKSAARVVTEDNDLDKPTP
jgi:hypothetical protein